MDEAAGRLALDGARRRRVYLIRHGAVDYVDPDGSWVPDPDAVSLNARGREQAERLAGLFANVPVDAAVCSGLPRTRETAEIVLGRRAIDIGIVSELEEIRPTKRADDYPELDLAADVAFTHWRAECEHATFLGGERYQDFYDRVTFGMRRILDDPGWHNLAVFAHGATNAAVLGWVSGLGKAAFGTFDQQNCCVNVIDFDVDTASRSIVRKTIRALNITVDDPAKHERRAGDLELLAGFLQRSQA